MRATSTLGSELVFAGLTVAAITVVYLLFMTISGAPAASGLIGHSIGVIGFLLMIATETLYSLRKRRLRRPIGRMSDWLRLHIYTGIVGPYLVLLHSSWQFQGLAGVTLLLTAAIVLSGFVGRYIYTAVPRTAHGAIVEQQVIQQQLSEVEEQLSSFDPAGGNPLSPTNTQGRGGLSAVMLRGPLDLAQRWTDWRRLRALEPADRAIAAELISLRRSNQKLKRQIQSLATARQLLSLWHALHVPLGVTLFLFAFVHIGAALYYATLLK